jgi:predicted naringenin-chalcone synthase
MVTVSRPVVRLPEHTATLDEMLAYVAKYHAGDPRLPVIDRVMRSSAVKTRNFVRDPYTILSSSNIAVDIEETFAGLRVLAAEAASGALAASGLRAAEVDCLIVTSVSGYAMPGLDVHVINQLGLRRDVVRIPLAQIGCAGGGYALARANDRLRAYPGSTVLIVCAEAFSVGLQPGDTTTDAGIWKGLGGDGAAACVVREDSTSPGFRLIDSRDHLLPDSEDRYRLTLDKEGLHFRSTKEALRAVAEALPEATAWLEWDRPGGWPLNFAIVHPGGLKILQEVARVLCLDPHILRHSYDSLAEIGNVTSVSVIDVLRRVHQDPTAHGPHGTRGVLVTFGPGFTTVVLKLQWSDGAAPGQ